MPFGLLMYIPEVVDAFPVAITDELNLPVPFICNALVVSSVGNVAPIKTRPEFSI